ncbi:hypothetical protein [Haloarchaeobius sp. DFWS5]|uniref:hypothetical protein n=1 Tax=Haloarchaeobius sp. DFWS5 TaxID=3446114 RepID=UPI003EC0C7AF
MTNDNDTTQPLSRRAILAGLGTIGVASAGAGLGTTAFFGDSERLQGWYEAGRVDTKLAFRSLYEPWERFELQPDDPLAGQVRPVAGDDMKFEQASKPELFDATDASFSPSLLDWLDSVTMMDHCADGVDLVDGVDGLVVALNDVKPGDSGLLTIAATTCGNPSFVSTALLEADDEGPLPRRKENGVFEPEVEAGDDITALGEQDGELPDFTYLQVSADPGLTGDFDGSNVLYEGSFTGFFEALELDPMLLAPISATASDPNCSAPDIANVYQLRWRLPTTTDDLSTFSSNVDVLVGNSFGIQFVDVESNGFDFEDELVARGYLEPNVNIAQTDSYEFGLTFSAQQCRGNAV